MPGISQKNIKFAKMIFDVCQKDLSYIHDDKKLLRKHITYIMRMEYATNYSISRINIPTKIKDFFDHPKVFITFQQRYKCIYDLWEHIIRACYDSTYAYYKFFGAKGITVNCQFLDGKKFCVWCLKHGFVSKPFAYNQYLQRKDKTKGYSPRNCFIITEKQRHECKSLSLALKAISLIKEYENGHDPSVIYMTFITRYYCYDFDVTDAKMTKYEYRKSGSCFGFKPSDFYDAVADENSCSKSVFIDRFAASYLTKNFSARPYDILKPDYSINKECAKQGIISYKQLWDREHPDLRYTKNNTNTCYNDNENSVYDNKPSINVYDNTDNVYS